MAQMTMALEDDASETVLDVDTQSRLDQTIANVEGYREKRHKASRFVHSNNARSLLWFHQEYEEYLACQKGLDAESNARRIQEMSPHDGETKVTQENLDEDLERIMSLTDDAFQTAPWMLTIAHRAWVPVVTKMQNHWRHLEKQKRRALKLPSIQKTAEEPTLDEILSCRCVKSHTIEMISGIGMAQKHSWRRRDRSVR